MLLDFKQPNKYSENLVAVFLFLSVLNLHVMLFYGIYCTAAVTFPVGANASSMAAVMALRSYSCCQFQSFLALLSSRTWGQLSAARE